MTDPTLWMTIAAASLLGLVITTQAALKGWRGWLDLRRLEIEQHRETRDDRSAPSPAARIEIADLKERVRKLEAIAAGVEL
ncbi:hypothetical protein CLG96_17665 [Sphingomonas oleivorans]|uniref:Uncharacterized protein n=1 Tax=Sphingomonas oleivorans TaxID=1735121 RepID=A0A2T5FTI6_9SPHN|nr:hypothetical protein [Sphingomonas oleivorans]PTQ07375.1 hypothetical protein CLG96_17665 [Sphingomonas oleivorans]